MYVTPRPDAHEDPNFGIRLGLVGVLAFAAIPIIDPDMPSIVAALPVGLIAAQRKAFNLSNAIAGPLTMIVVAWFLAVLVKWVAPLPLVFIGVMWLLYFVGFLMILRTDSQAGMLIVVMTVLISIMGMHGNARVDTLRDGFVQASLVALVIAPIVYFLVPARTRAMHIAQPEPDGGDHVIGALIRASVLLLVSFWLYSVMQPSDMMLAVIAAMVLVFPTRQTVYSEAWQRVRATMYGGAIAAAILFLFTLSSHLSILLGLIFLAGLWLGQGMLYGRHPSMVYQYGFSVALALVAGALSSQDPGYATFTRIVLTLAGAFTAAFMVAILDALLLKPAPERRIPEPTGEGRPVLLGRQ
jgi:hypothetical protein